MSTLKIVPYRTSDFWVADRVADRKVFEQLLREAGITGHTPRLRDAGLPAFKLAAWRWRIQVELLPPRKSSEVQSC